MYILIFRYILDPTGFIRVISVSNHHDYSHISSSTSDVEHAVKYHGRILSELLDDKDQCYLMKGVLSNGWATNRSVLGWPIYVSISCSSIDDMNYLDYYLEYKRISDLIVD